MKSFSTLLYIILVTAMAMLGYNINVTAGSWTPLFWSIVDFFLWPIALIKWCIFHQISMSVIRHTFHWFFN